LLESIEALPAAGFDQVAPEWTKKLSELEGKLYEPVKGRE